MAYLPDGLPAPEPTMDDAPFWHAVAERRLAFQQCADCGRVRHPPTPICGRCRSSALRWAEAPSHAVLFTYTVVHYAAHPAVGAAVPYNVAVVEFPELDGVRLISNLVDVAPGDLGIGMALELVWERAGEGWLPRFRAAREGASS